MLRNVPVLHLLSHTYTALCVRMHEYDYAVTECAYTEMHSVDYALNSKANFSIDIPYLKPTALLSQPESKRCTRTGGQ